MPRLKISGFGGDWFDITEDEAKYLNQRWQAGSFSKLELVKLKSGLSFEATDEKGKCRILGIKEDPDTPPNTEFEQKIKKIEAERMQFLKLPPQEKARQQMGRFRMFFFSATGRQPSPEEERLGYDMSVLFYETHPNHAEVDIRGWASQLDGKMTRFPVPSGFTKLATGLRSAALRIVESTQITDNRLAGEAVDKHT